MSKINTYDFVGMKKDKGKSKGFKNLQQDIKRKQKAQEILIAIQKIQNEPSKKKETKQAKKKNFKVYTNQEHSINHDIMCDEEAENDAHQEFHLQQLEEIYRKDQSHFSGEEYEEYDDWARRRQEEYKEKPTKSKKNYDSITNQNKDADLESQEDRETRNADGASFHDWHYGYSVSPIEDDDIPATYSMSESDSEEEEEENQKNETNEQEVLEEIVPKHFEIESRLFDLENTLSYTQESIYQLVKGLFNTETQKQLLKSHTEFLYTGRNYSDEELTENVYPTTRQGDENEQRIKHLEIQNALLKEQLGATQSSVYCLLGGLYNHELQSKVLTKHIDDLYLKNQDVLYKPHGENIFPSTRQGDAHSIRLERLEENIDILVKKLKKGKPLHRFYRKFRK